MSRKRTFDHVDDDEVKDPDSCPRELPPWLDDDLEALRECCTFEAHTIRIDCGNRRIRKLEQVWNLRENRDFSSCTTVYIENCLYLEIIPDWVGHIQNFVHFHVANCPRITGIPIGTYGRLLSVHQPKLHKLSIFDCENFHCLFPRCINDYMPISILHISGCSSFSPFLLLLALRNYQVCNFRLDGAKTLEKFPGDDDIVNLSSVQSLEFNDCPVLTEIASSAAWSSMYMLSIGNCPALKKLPLFPALYELRLTNVCFNQLLDGIHHQSSQLSCLKLSEVEPHSTETLAIELAQYPMLVTICVEGFPNLVTISGDWFRLSSMCNIFIESCPKLVSLPRMPHRLECLELLRLRSIRTFGEMLHDDYPFLQTVSVRQCQAFERLPAIGLDHNAPRVLNSEVPCAKINLGFCPSFRRYDFSTIKSCDVHVTRCLSVGWKPHRDFVIKSSHYEIEPLEFLSELHRSSESFFSTIVTDVVRSIIPFLDGGVFIVQLPPTSIEKSFPLEDPIIMFYDRDKLLEMTLKKQASDREQHFRNLGIRR
jgi:hypothetical protein